MLCVVCLKSHKWGLFPHRSDPHNDIISTKVNLFDTFWTRLNLTNFHRHYSCQHLFPRSGVLLHKRDWPLQQAVQKIRQQPRFGLLYFTKFASLWYIQCCKNLWYFFKIFSTFLVDNIWMNNPGLTEQQIQQQQLQLQQQRLLAQQQLLHQQQGGLQSSLSHPQGLAALAGGGGGVLGGGVQGQQQLLAQQQMLQQGGLQVKKNTFSLYLNTIA